MFFRTLSIFVICIFYSVLVSFVIIIRRLCLPCLHSMFSSVRSISFSVSSSVYPFDSIAFHRTPSPCIPLHPLMSSHANPCHSKSSHAHPCRSMPIQANRCQSTSIHANPCQSMLVHANPCQSMLIYLFLFRLFHYYSSFHLFIHVLLCRFAISADAIRDMDLSYL